LTLSKLCVFPDNTYTHSIQNDLCMTSSYYFACPQMLQADNAQQSCKINPTVKT
jgi:hypothetical protein